VASRLKTSLVRIRPRHPAMHAVFSEAGSELAAISLSVPGSAGLWRLPGPKPAEAAGPGAIQGTTPVDKLS